MMQQIVKLTQELKSMPLNALNSTPAPTLTPVAHPTSFPAADAHFMPHANHGLSNENALQFLFETDTTVVTDFGSQ